jgi:hypothetical protein
MLFRHSYCLSQAHDSASKQEEVAVWEEERRESKCGSFACHTANHALPEPEIGNNSIDLKGQPFHLGRAFLCSQRYLFSERVFVAACMNGL